MRIAHVVSTFPPYCGGQGNVAREIAERTAALGHEVVVVTPGKMQNAECKMQNDGVGIHHSSFAPEAHPPLVDIIHHSAPWLRLGNAAWCPGILRALEVLQSDLVHLHWPFIGGVSPVLAWRRHDLSRTQSVAMSPGDLSLFRSKLRKEVSARHLIVQYHMDLVGSGWRDVVFAAYQRRALPRVLAVADRIVVSSLDYARHGALGPFVEQLGDRLVEIPLGVDVGRFPQRPHPPMPPLPEEGGETKKNFSPSRREGELGGVGKFTVLFVGGLDRAHAFKGVDVLLRAIARLTDDHRSERMATDHGYRLRIIGDGDLRATFETQARVLGISDRVEFLGSVSDAELPGIYRNADVLVLPSTSRSEAFGVVLLEAMASGIPVIASDLPGVRTVVADGETGFLVPPGDVEALAQRLAMLARDPVKLRGKGAAARRRMEERYAWDRIMNVWDACYASL